MRGRIKGRDGSAHLMEVLTIRDCMETYGMSHRQIHYAINRDKLTCVKAWGTWLITRSSVETFMGVTHEG